jgi:lipid A 3-O-deacylase
LIRYLKLFLLLLSTSALPAACVAQASDNPVALVRAAKSWHFGPFVNYGNGVGARSQYHFLSAGVEVGKPLTPVLPLGPLSGQFELGANLMPLWDGFTPAPHEETRRCTDPDGGTSPCVLPVGGGRFDGVSLTPVILRWNFATRARHFQPWFQGAGGLIYTTHKFPPDVLVPHGIPGGTSVWNFSPQGGVGVHWFTRSHRSIDMGVNAVHISSSSLGDKNPGVNASIQVQVGYTFWR